MYKDQPYWGTYAAFGICMAYDRSSGVKPPQTWSDLLDPSWRGRLGLEDIRTAGSQYGQYYLLREKLGRGFWRELLGRQEPRIFMRTSDLADALLKGEIDLAAEFSIHTAHFYGDIKGTPIKAIFPTQGVPLVLTPTAILANAEHVDEARTFTDFLLSPEGQEMMQRLTFKYSVRRDVAPLPGEPPLSAVNPILPADLRDYSLRREEYISEFEEFRGGTR